MAQGPPKLLVLTGELRGIFSASSPWLLIAAHGQSIIKEHGDLEIETEHEMGILL
jgi:hypothetical protein